MFAAGWVAMSVMGWRTSLGRMARTAVLRAVAGGSAESLVRLRKCRMGWQNVSCYGSEAA